MPDLLSPFSSEILPHVRLADIVDIALVATFLYAVFTWVRESTSRSASRRTLAVAVSIALVYGLAQMLELYLVEQLIELLALVLAVAAGIAFQSDIRRLIDRIASRGPYGGKRPTAPTAAINTLVEACAKMAERRVGALVALRGREPWDRYVEGGIRLDGVVSLPLLLATFNPKAPGHDGAVLMEGDRVLRFGAHLPLSSRLPESSRYGGTRHAAAQGLSEHCDAFVIVVSEERGVISVAQHGTLRALQSPVELKAGLESFWTQHYGEAEASRPRWYERRTLQTGFFALLAAVLLWVTVAYRPEVRTRTFEVPVELRDLGPYVRIQSAGPSNARITLTGTEQAFRMLEPAELVVALDGARIAAGETTFLIDETTLDLPPDLSLVAAAPNEVVVRARSISRRVPVVVERVGEAPDGVRIRAVRTVPDSVRVVLADTTVTLPDAMTLTDPIDVSAIRTTTRIGARLRLPEGLRLAEGVSRDVTVVVEAANDDGAP